MLTDSLLGFTFRPAASTMATWIEQDCRQAGFEPQVTYTSNELMEANNGRTSD